MLKRLEEPILLFGRDAGTGVGHADHDLSPVALGPHLYPAPFCEAPGVAQQVYYDLSDARGVTEKERKVARRVYLQRETFRPK